VFLQYLLEFFNIWASVGVHMSLIFNVAKLENKPETAKLF